MTNQKKTYRTHLAVGIVSLALVGGVAGTAYAASNMPGRGNGQHMTSTARGTMMNGSQGTGGGMGYGTGTNQVMPMATAATYLGLSQSDLQTQLHADKSLTTIATAQGKSVTGLSDALSAAMTARVNANTNLTAEQKTTMIAQIKSHVATMLTQTDHQGRMGSEMDSHMGTGMGSGSMSGHMTVMRNGTGVAIRTT